MNLDRVEKIKKLVLGSKIFSDSERSEWFSLIDLMNDKQMLELERILDSGQAQILNSKLNASIQSKPQVASAQPIVKPVSAQPPSPSISRQGNLSHIVNLPNVGGTVSAQKSTTNGKSSPFISNSESQHSFNRQVSQAKLKNTITEKELTTSKPTFQLELEDGKHPKNVGHKSFVGVNEAFDRLLKPKAPPVVPAPPKPLVAAASPIKPTAKPEPTWENNKVALDILAKLKEPEAAKGGLQKWPQLKSLGEKRAPVLPTTPSSIIKDLPVAKPQIIPTAQAVEPSFEEEKSSNLNFPLEKPEDLSKLNLQLWQGTSTNSLTVKLKDMVETFGYHNVIFNLETSPLYKTYINTGTKLLNEDTSFENLQKDKTEYCNRTEFEKFTDLLMKIQAS